MPWAAWQQGSSTAAPWIEVGPTSATVANAMNLATPDAELLEPHTWGAGCFCQPVHERRADGMLLLVHRHWDETTEARYRLEMN